MRISLKNILFWSVIFVGLVIGFVMIFRSLVFIIAPVPLPTPNSAEILRLVNYERSRVGVAPLVSDPRLVRSAQMKADDMLKNDYNAHVDRNGKHGYEYIVDVLGNEPCANVGENLFWGDGKPYDSPVAVRWWMSSKLHHDAMLDPKNKLTGIAISGNKVVQHFCQPR